MNNDNPMNSKTETRGFIILRHVNDVETNQYWNKCYACIRKYYPEEPIVIIDDNSDYKFVNATCSLYNVNIIYINPKYIGRGELLPYIYYLKYKFFDTAVIIQDSVFINQYIDFSCKNFRYFWTFDKMYDVWTYDKFIQVLKLLDAYSLYCYYLANNNSGCFGAMMVINHDVLVYIDSIYNLNQLIDQITCKEDRKVFERIIGLMLCYHYLSDIKDQSHTYFGDIHQYCEWGLPFNVIDSGNYINLPLIKVWKGR